MTQTQSAPVTQAIPQKPLTTNAHLVAWVEEMAKLTKPDQIVW